MQSCFGEPRIEYSPDHGNTWREGVPVIGEHCFVRVITEQGEILFTGRAVAVEEICAECKGTGKRKRYRYVKV